jgi:hypothetical protein
METPTLGQNLDVSALRMGAIGLNVGLWPADQQDGVHVLRAIDEVVPA